MTVSLVYYLAEGPGPVFSGVATREGAGPLPEGRELLLHAGLPHHQLHQLLTPANLLASPAPSTSKYM